MPEINILSALDAARQKGCTRQAIYDALSREALTEVRTGGMRLVLKDEKFDSYKPQYTDESIGAGTVAA